LATQLFVTQFKERNHFVGKFLCSSESLNTQNIRKVECEFERGRIDSNQGCGSGWLEAEAVKFLWKRKHYEEAESGSIWPFEEPETEAFFIKHGARMWKRKRLNFYGSGSRSTLKKEAGSERKLGSD